MYHFDYQNGLIRYVRSPDTPATTSSPKDSAEKSREVATVLSTKPNAKPDIRTDHESSLKFI